MASGERDRRWDPSVRRELRQELRSALEDTCSRPALELVGNWLGTCVSFPAEHAEETAQPDELRRRLRHADSLQKKGGRWQYEGVACSHSCFSYSAVVAPREAAIDAEHIKVLSEIAREKVQSSRGELVEFEPVVYCEKLVG